ncbi:MAG: response regulator, partial [Bacteroidales bacterium]|nr:response regulator [Bacteroidales bacterium]
YQFKSQPDQISLIAKADSIISQSNAKLELFSNLDAFFIDYKKDKDNLTKKVATTYFDALSGDNEGHFTPTDPGYETLKSARFLIKRMHLFYRIQPKILDQTSAATHLAHQYAMKIRSEYSSILANPSQTDFNLVEAKMKEPLNKMSIQETTFANNVKQMSIKLAYSLSFILILLLSMIVVVTLILSRLMVRSVSVPILRIVENLKKMAVGDISGVSLYSSSDEIGQLSDSYREMQFNLLSQVEQAKRVAKGDFEQTLTPRSENDDLTIALNEMTASLKKVRIKNDRDNWIKSCQNELGFELQGDIDLTSVGQKISGLVSRQLNALTSALFAMDEAGVLQFIGGYAVNSRQAHLRIFKPGEGLPGQVSADGKAVIIEDVPDDYLDIFSGLGSQKPRYLMIIPCMYNNKTEGVLELGSLKPFSDVALDYINLVSESIAVAIQASKSRTALQELLAKQIKLMEELQLQQEELRQTNEELQVQQEELRQSNEELETQTRELEESKMSLQAQQEELRVTNEELSERTHAIENQRETLRKKNDELEKARQDIENKARELEQISAYKSEFLANMSHELRTPLNSILVLSQILAENKPANLNERQIKSAETIKSSGENLLVLINEILDLAKIESGKVELNIEPIDIHSFMADLSEVFLPVAEEKGLSFSLDIADGTPQEIRNDSLRLGQILRNLISNGIKFTDKGSVHIIVSRPVIPDGQYQKFRNRKDLIGFSVQDSGIGIHRDKQKEIFEAFRQADGTTSRKFGGTGLGLAISRNFARMMGGDILLQSTPDEGSTFTLIVPERLTAEPNPISASLMDIPIMAPVLKQPEKPIEEFIFQNSVNKTDPEDLSINDDRKDIQKGDTFLLIIKDDVSFAQIIFDLAHDKNFKCMIAPNGETGLHYADYYNPSAIILDIGLPGIDGWEVMERLQENPHTRHIPVHFMSGSDKSLEALKKGAIGFLRKPVTVDEINEAFDKIEGLISKPLKKLLVVEDDEAMRLSIIELIGEENIHITSASKGNEALDLLKKESFDAMILDLGLEDMTGYDLLQRIGKKQEAHKMPVIIYTGKELTREEEEKLQSYSDRIIIKGIKSPERLLAETTLFLHQVESNLPAEKQKKLRNIHSKEDVMKDKSILIVDDDMRNVFALTSLLEDLGLKILIGKNGKEGIEKLRANHVDLILMDIMMPEMNGYEAMEEIRKDVKFRRLPIIALTAKAMPGDREKCIRAGATDYLTKPIDSEKLISILRVWLYKN